MSTEQQQLYSWNDLRNAIHSVGITAGDLVMMHIGIERIGIPRELENGKFPEGKINAFYKEFVTILEELGTVLIPAFSYSFCGKQEIFDPKTTPSKVGGFSNYIIQQGRWKRSMDPLFSMLGWGKLIDELFMNLPQTSFGNNCLFARLLQHNAKVCYIGGLDNILTAFHHFEYLNKVPYRYEKNFHGIVVTNTSKEDQDWTYWVRVLDARTVPTTVSLERDLLNRGIMKRIFIGNSHISGFNLKDYFDAAQEYIDKDIFSFIQEPIPLGELNRLIQDDIEKSKGVKNK
ncbi:MAG: AAC(3) family N-acetyltransferase [Planctomycetaceae bacterium]|jgi:aminoglycoside 3-N-acetyltransferase|nr:AAC(3) family N-acetyltransferase [Planctomycetaceae bacterium]